MIFFFKKKNTEIFEEVVNIFGGSNMSYFKNGDFSLDAYFLFHFQLVQTILKRSLMDRPSYCDRQGTVLWSIAFPLFVAFDEIRQIMCKLWLKSTVHTTHFSLDALFQAIHNRYKPLVDLYLISEKQSCRIKFDELNF